MLTNMNSVIFELKHENKEAIVSIVSTDNCFLRKIRDDILHSDWGYMQGNLARIQKGKWDPKECGNEKFISISGLQKMFKPKTQEIEETLIILAKTRDEFGENSDQACEYLDDEVTPAYYRLGLEFFKFLKTGEEDDKK